MKPPSQDAIAKALGILLDSIQEENGLDFALSYNPSLSVIPLERLVSNVDALRVATSHLDQGAGKSIRRIQVYRNSVASIHRIPAEVFELILHKATDENAVESARTLYTLMSVCRHWHSTIVSCPRLCTRLDPDLPVEVARLVIERSKSLPILSLRWYTYARGQGSADEDSDEAEDFTNQDEVWEVVRQNFERFRSMSLIIYSQDGLQIRSLLESTNTALESLHIDSYHINQGARGPLALSDGPPLKHLSLRATSFNFDTPRLSELVTLRLSYSAVPRSLKTLVQVLSATAAQLEELTISDFLWMDDYRPSSSITFPRLAKLDLSNITVTYCTTLVATIYAPACSHVRAIESHQDLKGPAKSLDAVIWQPGSTQVAAFLGLDSRSEPHAFRITIKVVKKGVEICVQDRGRERASFRFRRSQPRRLAGLICEFFLHHTSPFAIDLDLSESEPESESRDGPSDVIPWILSGRLKALNLSNHDDCLSALEQLGRRAASPRWSGMEVTEDWICPNLRSIVLEMPRHKKGGARHVAALQSLVDKRWSGADSGLEPANQPTKFRINCDSSSYKTLRIVEGEIREIVPCFEFYVRGG
ncbi:hypothetical protein FS837_002721 [Tulasnella sp. UAMH 9824]|nr:hypothetical protein FS837_002721 [Tulasnella sp. UAMH 9824]